jgi:hypothetical protein
MIYYIRIKKLNGRRDFVELAEKLYDRGYDDRVEYHAGKEIPYGQGLEGIDPHLKFNNEEDALAYVLAYGGTILTHIPTWIIAGG